MLLTLSFRNWLFEYFDSQCGYTSVCTNLLGNLLDLFSSQLRLSGLKQVLVSFLWEKWQLFSLMGYISPFLVECCGRFETEAQNNELERTIALNSPWLWSRLCRLRQVLEQDRARAGGGSGWLASFVFSAALGTWEFGSTYPSKQANQL